MSIMKKKDFYDQFNEAKRQLRYDYWAKNREQNRHILNISDLLQILKNF